MRKIERVENLVRFVLAQGIGCAGVNRLLRHFGDSDRVLGASEAELRAAGMRPAQITAVLQARTLDPRPEIDAVAEAGIDFLAYDDPEYPAGLLNISDPPPLLYVKGKIRETDQQALGVVGARVCSNYGREQCARFAAGLARVGYCVVSGLARGIDTCAHNGALAAGGRTVAFVGCGLKHVYPPENRDLMAEIAAHGAVVSEFPFDTQPAAQNFPRRNRLIAGFSLGVLVVEASEKSGSLITARQALDMGREVFAIPGRIDHEECAGCHALIREGAVLVRKLDDILEELPVIRVENQTSETNDAQGNLFADAVAETDGHASRGEDSSVPPGGKKSARKKSGTTTAAVKTAVAVSPEQQRILDALAADESVHIDDLAVTLETTAGTLLAGLLKLELRGLVRQLPGKFFALRR